MSNTRSKVVPTKSGNKQRTTKATEQQNTPLTTTVASVQGSKAREVMIQNRRKYISGSEKKLKFEVAHMTRRQASLCMEKPSPLPSTKESKKIIPCPPVPARMLNEYVYCPRLAYLEWVQKEWQESSDTVEGRFVHRRVDQSSSMIPETDYSNDRFKVVRSVEIESDKLNLVAKIDLVEFDEAGHVTPIDYKRGKRPHVSNSAYDPERVQLCAQALLLEEKGYQVTEGVLYFASSKERVRVSIDDKLRTLTLNSLRSLQQMVLQAEIPPPLVDSPKCNRCALVSICLPDEVNLLRAIKTDIRPVSIRHVDSLPLYVHSHGAKVSKKGERLEVTTSDAEECIPVRLMDVSQLVVSGNVHVTTPALHELMSRQIPITWLTHGGWFLGHTVGTGHANVEVRTAQYRCSFDDSICLRLAKGLIRSKIRNCRIILRRNWMDKTEAQPILARLKTISDQVYRVRDIQHLLGLEGTAASLYWSVFSKLFKTPKQSTPKFNMQSRNRRPPADPVNAMLSYGYSILTRSVLVALSSVGLDPYRGFLHQPRYGRPSLALDVMEPFRPLIVDSAVLTAINTEEVKLCDFIETPIGTNFKNVSRKRFLAILERRFSQEITHPLFGYKVQYRRLLELQARLLTRFLLGEIPEYPNFETR